jgi:hypothetical protein
MQRLVRGAISCHTRRTRRSQIMFRPASQLVRHRDAFCCSSRRERSWRFCQAVTIDRSLFWPPNVKRDCSENPAQRTGADMCTPHMPQFNLSSSPSFTRSLLTHFLKQFITATMRGEVCIGLSSLLSYVQNDAFLRKPCPNVHQSCLSRPLELPSCLCRYLFM